MRCRVDFLWALLDSATVIEAASRGFVNKMQSNGSRVRPRWLDLTLGAFGALLFAPVVAQSPPAASAMPPGHPPSPQQKAAPAAPIKRVDINSASRAELKTLPGIGDAEATRIIAGRPYLTKVDLITKKVLPEGVYVALRDQIVAKQSGLLVSKK